MTVIDDAAPTRLPSPCIVELPGAARDVVLDVLRNGPLARSEIARRLNINPGYLTRVVQSLIDAGLLRETGDTDRKQFGRPSRPLSVVAEVQYIVGVKVTADSIHAVVCDLASTIVDSITIDYQGTDPANAVAAINRACAKFAGFSPLAIGVTLGAQIRDAWRVRVAPVSGWRDVPVGAMVEEATGLPTIVTNDMTALTTAEHWFGSGRGVQNFAIVTIGAGVGYGLVSNGVLAQNADTGLGLIGHEPVSRLGSLCPLGHRGCAMTALTFDGLGATVSAALGRPVGFDECLRLARSGDPVASAAIDDSATALGGLLASVATLALPDKIVVAGEGIELAEITWPRVLETFHSRRPPEAEDPDIQYMHIEQSTWAKGAAVTAIEWCLAPDRSNGHS